MRNHNYAVFDTETVGLHPKLIYDLGVIVCNRNGNEIARKSWIVREVMTDSRYMLGAYYSAKVFTHYIPALADGTLTLHRFADIRRDFNALIEEHNIKTVCAYNFAFDRMAMRDTLAHLNIDDQFIQHPIKFLDLWFAACSHLVNTNKYRKFCRANGFISDADNVRTNAECVYAYLFNNPTFKESHTAIEDCEIEAKILTRIIKRKQNLLKNKLHPMPWQIVQRKNK